MPLLLWQATIGVPAEPSPLTETHSRDVGCVAILGLVADQQKRGSIGFKRFGDIADRGRVMAADVGERIVKETGQAPEVVAIAMQESAREQLPLLKTENSAALDSRMAQCLPLLDAIVVVGDIATADDFRRCAAIVFLLSGKEDERFENEGLLFENLVIQYKRQVYGRGTQGTVFARADVLKHVDVLKNRGETSYGNAQVEQCVDLGTGI